jgi:VanZ family protein
MADQEAVPHHRGRFAGWAIVYALVIAYASLIVGPIGFHFVPLDPETAWQIFKATPYVVTGSDQRPDWMANLLMLVPLGWLVTGAFWPRRDGLRWLAAVTALCCCLILVLAIKYLQLFFPPRTVTLNYIEAQSLGSLLGVGLFWLLYDRGLAWRQGLRGGGRRPLVIGCWIYAAALLFFFLFPFDFALSAEDFRKRAAVLPHMLLSWPGEGLPQTLRVLIVMADAAATIPLGVLLSLESRRRSLLRIAGVGFVAMSVVTVLTTLVLSASPSLVAVFYRTAGIVAGAAIVTWCEGQDPRRWRDRLARLVPVMIPPYLVSVLFVSDLLTPHWRTIWEALAALDEFGLLPFYHHYIVSKAHAAESVVIHVLIFTPIGVMMALRRGSGRIAVWTAAIIAASFSLVIEFGRWFKPGLQPDFSNAIIAPVAAGLAVRLTDWFWRMLEGAPIAATTPSATDRVGVRDDAARRPHRARISGQ